MATPVVEPTVVVPSALTDSSSVTEEV